VLKKGPGRDRRSGEEKKKALVESRWEYATQKHRSRKKGAGYAVIGPHQLSINKEDEPRTYLTKMEEKDQGSKKLTPRGDGARRTAKA